MVLPKLKLTVFFFLSGPSVDVVLSCRVQANPVIARKLLQSRSLWGEREEKCWSPHWVFPPLGQGSCSCPLSAPVGWPSLSLGVWQLVILFDCCCTFVYKMSVMEPFVSGGCCEGCSTQNGFGLSIGRASPGTDYDWFWASLDVSI